MRPVKLVGKSPVETLGTLSDADIDPFRNCRGPAVLGMVRSTIVHGISGRQLLCSCAGHEFDLYCDLARAHKVSLRTYNYSSNSVHFAYGTDRRGNWGRPLAQTSGVGPGGLAVLMLLALRLTHPPSVSDPWALAGRWRYLSHSKPQSGSRAGRRRAAAARKGKPLRSNFCSLVLLATAHMILNSLVAHHGISTRAVTLSVEKGRGGEDRLMRFDAVRCFSRY